MIKELISNIKAVINPKVGYKSEQRTFCYCSSCNSELISSDSFIVDTYVNNANVVHYNCKACGKDSYYNFDIAPMPIPYSEIENSDNIIEAYKEVSIITYIPQDLSLKYHKDCYYLIELNNLTLPIYFGLKYKHNYTVSNKHKFYSNVQSSLPKVDLFIIPESNNDMLNLITLHKNMTMFKNDKDTVKQLMIQNNKYSKNEIDSLNKSFDSMNKGFQIHKLKLNKRKDAIPYLFKETQFLLEELPKYKNKHVCILDDLSVSNSTIQAMEYILSKHNIFYNKISIFKDLNV